MTTSDHISIKIHIVRVSLISLELSDISLFLQSEHPVGTELEILFRTVEEKGFNCGHHCINLIGKEILQKFMVI